MAVYINDITTAVPDSFEHQQEVREIMKESVPGDRKTRSIIHRIYSQSGIEKRHAANYDFNVNGGDGFFNRVFKNDLPPTTGERNSIYERESKKLFLRVADQLMEQNPDLDRKSITHVITVSCTGFYAPGPDFEVVRHLGLSPSTQRFHIGFMGCYAAFPALKMAESFCKADPNTVVLIISCELCSLHLQISDDIDQILAASVFADGAAGVLVSTREPQEVGYRLDEFSSTLAYEGEKDMAWTISDTGFKMVLSSYIPSIIETNIDDIMKPMFDSLKISKEDIGMWAVHPGGRAIVDKVEQGMGVDPAKVQPSRNVLSQFGNMSSATILFVLDEIRKSQLETDSKVLPIAFGPGLTIETGIFTFIKH
ncbi:MAG: type III polyketide synthase [Balneolaceae bacterium]